MITLQTNSESPFYQISCKLKLTLRIYIMGYFEHILLTRNNKMRIKKHMDFFFKLRFNYN